MTVFSELPGWRIKPSLLLVILLRLSHLLELLHTSHRPLSLLTLATTILLGLILLWMQGAVVTILFLYFPISTYLSLQPFFPRYQRFVREGGSAEYSDFLEAILPSLVDVLGDPEDYRLRGRRSGAQRAAADKVKADALAKEVTQRSRLHKASSGPMGFQVPLFICFLCRS